MGDATTVAARQAEWQRAASHFLPLEPPQAESPWRFSGAPQRDLPRQGWKLHVSATVLSATEVLEAVGPLLHARAVFFKGPKTLQILKQLNCGLFFGYHQVGKFLTVYPRTEEEACELAAALHGATAGSRSPAIPFERPVACGSSVFTRYGAFGSHDGTPASGARLETPDGDLVDDDRTRNPEWARCPEALIAADPGARGADGPLATSYRAYEALMQRGKGGVYRALDLTLRPARLCVLKEGRAAGEMDWDGADGRQRVTHERDVLIDLRHASVPVPEVYDAFEQGEHAYVAMEWLEGRSLSEFVHTASEPLAIGFALDLGARAASILSAIHARGWVWRDLKAANLMFCDGSLRPLDFEGAARAGDPTTSPWGTTGYAPPEWLDLDEASPCQDTYALGVLLHELLTGVVPVSHEPPTPVDSSRPDVPADVTRLIGELTRQPPDRRPSAGDAYRRLEAVQVSPFLAVEGA